MEKKLIGIFICMLLILSAFVCTANVKTNSLDKEQSCSIDLQAFDIGSFTLKPDIEWQDCYDFLGLGKQDSLGKAILNDAGDYIQVGYLYNDTHDANITLVKRGPAVTDTYTLLNSFGNPNEEEFAEDFQQTADGGYIIAGRNRSYFDPDSAWNGLIIKTDSSGTLQWRQWYGKPSSSDVCFSIKQIDGGYYIVVGQTRNYSSGNDDVWLLKINETGYVGDDDINTFEKTFNGPSNLDDAGLSVQQNTTDGSFIIAGNTRTISGEPFLEYWLIKTDEDGNHLWDNTFSAPDSLNNNCYCVDQTIDGGYVLAGSTQLSDAEDEPYWDYYVVKTDQYGVQEMDNRYGGYAGDFCYSVEQTPDSGYLIAGHSFSWASSPSFDAQAWVIKTDQFLIPCNYASSYGDCWQSKYVWAKTFGNIGNFKQDYALSANRTMDGGYIIGGSSMNATSNSMDLWMIKIDPSSGFRRPAPPDPDGPPHGRIGTEYEYIFNSIDPDDEDVFYYIDWGDDTYDDWFGPFASGTDTTASHTWTERGTYMIKAKAKDIFDLESDWATFEVTIPRFRAIDNPILRFFEIHPLLFRLLQLLIQR